MRHSPTSPSESGGLLQPAGTGPLREHSGDTEEETEHKGTEVRARIKAELASFCIRGPGPGLPPGAQTLPFSWPLLQGSSCLEPAFRELSVSSAAISRNHQCSHLTLSISCRDCPLPRWYSQNPLL